MINRRALIWLILGYEAGQGRMRLWMLNIAKWWQSNLYQLLLPVPIAFSLLQSFLIFLES